MLIEFKVANYRSIRAEQTLSMVASNYSDELPQNLISCDHVPGLKGTKLVKAVALYGANASGKSNIVAALRFFAEFVRDSATKLQPGDPTGAQPFKLDPACLTEPSKFEITAVINGIRTLYGIEMTRERVTSEYLVAYPKGRPQVWFERDRDEGKGKYAWSKSMQHFKHDAALREKTRENAAFLSVAAQFDHKLSGDVREWVATHFQHVGLRSVLAGDVGAQRTIELMRHSVWRDHLLKFFVEADLGVKDARLRKMTKEDYWSVPINYVRVPDTSGYPGDKALETVMRTVEKQGEVPELLHKAKGKSLPLAFYQEESGGTHRLFALIGDLAYASLFSWLAVIDEIEESLHPLLVHSLIAAHFTGVIPASTSQLLFTTHNPLLLDQTLLRRDQIWFTEKDQEGATRLYPLTDFKPRKDESLVKGYLAGRYGGIPFIPEGLKF